MPMPTRISREPLTPPPRDSRWIATATTQVPPNDQAETAGPRDAQHDDREHRGGAGARRHADDVRAGERVAQHRLEHGAGDAERDADERAGHRARQLVLHHDEGRARDVGAGHDADQVGQGDGEGAELDLDEEQHDHRDAERRDHAPGPPRRRTSGPGDRRRRVGTGQQGGHRLTAERRRISQTKTGAPTSAVISPACTSVGGSTTRPIVSAPTSSAPPSSAETGSTQR